ncbi:penicillin-binding protein activator [Pseudooceanicola sp.]|uniref:penicillin-binding protein activator n=1 Tax=Pseudooceanicola sp. TaxID=1914328 RepID=UPI0026194433|nr:penicillin-binding protein activator [Pseudooceanicola sp.]MDF1856126.1 penicillin-binding protein activator [Pseudooceanicola sp.]
MFALIHAASKRTAQMVLAAVTGLALIACQPVSLGGGLGSGPAIDSSKPVPVALLLPKGSGASGDAVLSTSLENAARMAIADLNGVRIDLRVYDTAGNAATAQAVADRAVADGAKIILGPVYAGNANAVGHAVARSGINVLAFSNNASIAGGNVFVLGNTFQNTADRLASFAVRQGKGRIVLVHSNDVAGQTGAAAIQTGVARAGGSIVSTVAHEFSQQGVVNAVPQVRSAVQSGGADAIFLTANTAGALPLFSQMLPEQGVSPSTVQYIGLTRWDIPAQTLDLPGVQGGWFALTDPNRAAQFDGRYQSTYGAPPHPIGSLAYDGIAAIGALVAQGRGLGGADLTQAAGFQGTGGIFRLLPDGTNQRGLAVATIQNRQVVVIDPAPRGFGGAGF